MWTAEFEKDPTLGVMEDCYSGLQTKGYKFETPSEPPPPAIDDEIRRKEEEELQRVLEMSMQDRGGRGAWSSTTGDAYSSASGYVGGYVASGSASGSGNRTNGHASGSGSGYASASGSGSGSGGGHPSYTSSSSIYSGASSMGQSITTPRTSTPSIAADTGTGITSDSSSTETQPSSPLNLNAAGIVTRVKALHAFQPTEPGELAFEKGDVIKVVDRGYRDWWRGQLRGRTGIFPVNYVEALPEPTPTELAKEAEAEAAVFAQAINVEKLLTLLRGFDNTKGNLADDEEIQELYRSSMALRPKIVKLIDKYSQKRADLVSMNETFLRARNIFDRMMEDSLARHTGVYSDAPYGRQSTYGPQARPDSRVSVAYGQPPQPYGPQAGGLPGYEQAHAGYTAFPQPQPQPGPYPSAVNAPGSGGYPQQQQQQGGGVYGAQTPGAYGQPQPQSYGQQGPAPYPAAQQQQPQLQPQPEQQQQQQQQPQPQPAQTAQPQQHAQQQQQQPQPQPQPQPQAQAQVTQGNPSGPPYVYDPKATYADPNVQAWVQYYAQGGKDPTGSVYFISVPGVKEPDVGGAGVGGPQGQGQGEQGVGGAQGQGQGQQGQNQNQVYQYPQQTQQAQGSTASLGGVGAAAPVGASTISPAGSVGSLHGAGPVTTGSVESLPYPGDQQPQHPSMGPRRDSSLPDPYASAGANVMMNPNPSSPTSPIYQQQQHPGISPAQSVASIPLGAGSGVVPGTPTSPVHPQQQQQPAAGYGASPYNHPNASQPSWLLPKMGSPPKTFASVPSSIAGEQERSSSPQHQQQQGGYGQAPLYHGLQGQMSGLSLSDGQGHGQGQGGYQGVGATA